MVRAVCVLFLVVFACIEAPASAAVAPLPNPDLPLRANGQVYAIARQPDGGILFGGAFSEVDGMPRSNLARLEPDGTLDPMWTPAPDQAVYAIAVDANSNAVYIGGLFSSVGDEYRASVAKIAGDGVGAVDLHWNPGTDGFVPTLAVGADGSVYIGGEFFTVNGTPRTNLAKTFGPRATVDPNWNPSPNARVLQLNVDAQGSIYVAGRFTTIGATNQSYIARLAADGAGDVDSTWNPSADGGVGAMALDDAGSLYVVGGFTEIGGQPRNAIARLSTTTGAADALWNPSAQGEPLAISVAGDAVYAGGDFTAIGGVPRARLAKLSAGGTGDVDAGWDAPADSRVNVLLADADGVYAGGSFTAIGGATRRGFVQIAATDSSATRVLDTAQPGEADAMVRESDGGTIVGGAFYAAGAAPRANILRLLPDGTLDPSWHPVFADSANGASTWVPSLALDDDGGVYAGGVFDSVDGIERHSLVRLAADGSVDAAWHPAVDGEVHALARGADDALYVGGAFTEVAGTSRSNLARVSTTDAGTVDAAWDPAPNFAVLTLATDVDGALFAGGDFDQIGGEQRICVAKLDAASGVVDANWNPGTDGNVYALLPDGRGSIYVGGEFFTISGESRMGIARLSTSGAGAADPVWDPTHGLFGFVYAMALDDAGSIYLGGAYFLLSNGANSLARVPIDGDGTADADWAPSVSGGFDGIRALSLQAGAITIAGGFVDVSDEARWGLAALPTGTVDDSIFANGFE
jgi:uncharacterized delta-60 repeat protein